MTINAPNKNTTLLQQPTHYEKVNTESVSFAEVLTEAVKNADCSCEHDIESDFVETSCACESDKEVNTETEKSCYNCEYREQCLHNNPQADNAVQADWSGNAKRSGRISQNNSSLQEQLNVMGNNSFIYDYNNSIAYKTRKIYNNE